MEPTDTDERGSPETDPPRPSEPFFVVGIGASAGGLEALSAFLRRVTIDGASFVVVQHLAPNQTSMLTELLGRASRLEVVTAEDNAAVKPNIVYVTPPNVGLVMHNGLIRLQAPDGGAARVHLPVDTFFQSLAEDCGAHAIGVVLSGTGRDGSVGLAAIKAAGGITFVQDPKTAKFDGMPRSALESGAADFCLSPEAIADEILQVSEHPYLRRRQGVASSEQDMAKLGGVLKRAFGVDLSHYKPATIERRLQRRMAVHRLERIADYVQLCQNDPKEVAALHRDLLINVTAFFRDGEPFEVL
jgi:two-component system CheB/CheR fusion protein